MATQAEERNAKILEQARRELARRSNDRIKVFNPDTKNFTLIFDGFLHVFPTKKEKIVPRYIWDRFKIKMTDHLINKENDIYVEEENERRIKSGQKIMDHQERELFDLRTDDPKLVEKYLPQLYLGLVEEYGGDVLSKEKKVKIDNRPIHEQVSEKTEESFEGIKPKKPTKRKRRETKKDDLRERIRDAKKN